MKKNTLVISGCILLAGGSLCLASAAAEDAPSRTQRVEKRIVAGEPGPARAEKQPVTYLGVAVAVAPEALAAQLELPEGQGLVVEFVRPDSPAASAGLQRFDVLLRLDDQILIDPRQLSVLVRNRKEGDAVEMTFLRAGAEQQVSVTLGQREMPVRDLMRMRRGPFGADPLLMPGIHEDVRELMREHPLGLPLPAPAPAPGPLPRMRILRPMTNFIYTDDQGTFELNAGESGRTLRATDPAGKLIFEGPIGTEEQRRALPEELRKRLHEIDEMEIEPPAPPAAPPPPLDPRANEAGMGSERRGSERRGQYAKVNLDPET